MADSFADLWNSTAPSKPSPPPQKLGSAIPPTNINRRPQQDVFSMLSSAASSAPSSRPITPSVASIIQSHKPASKPTPKGASGDAFSGLLAGSLGANSSNGANLTIAERAAKAEKERIEQLLKHQESVRKQSSAWDGLDKLANSSTAVIRPSSNPQTLDANDWPFDSAVPVKVPSKPSLVQSPPQIHEDDDWGLDDFATQAPKPRVSVPKPRSQSLWDLDEFSSSPAGQDSHPRPDSPGEDFDFGDREDALQDDDAGNQSHDEDDILGLLSKPVDAIPRRSPQSRSNRATPSPQANQNGSTHSSLPASRAVSPPPHIIGQIVEMGFSPQQARIALAATDTGLDVQAALETLLSNGAGAEPVEQSPPPPTINGLDESQRRRRPSRGAGGPPAPVRERLTRDRERDIRTPSPSGSQQERNIQDQADKLLAQASEIGLTVLSRANAFWNTGKEKVQKAYEERTRTAAPASGPTRPKWMQDSVPPGNEVGRRTRDTAFSDDIIPAKPPRPNRPPVAAHVPYHSPAEVKTADLFSDEPAAYVSPFRRGRPKAQEEPIPQPPRAPSPVRLAQRHAISASSAAISSSAKHKAVGGEKFKLGQYGEAETAYTAAIAALPESHLLLVPLYNNRSLTRLKTGDHAGAVEDSTTVITLIGAGYHPQREAKVTRDEEGAGVDLGDALVKAWKRRAEAYESREKWAMAQRDWEAVAAADWAGSGVRGEAVRGAGRCRRMTVADNEAGSVAAAPSLAPPRRPKPPVAALRHAPRQGQSPPSQALRNLRKANEDAEAEDQARYDLKDSVDARLLGWKAGKEANIRALIASLDTVLWPELGWQKVGMADLVSPSQVKIRYTKAIAKLHPDKLRPDNTTLEHRMIANGVFGALNEAWNAFKQ